MVKCVFVVQYSTYHCTEPVLLNQTVARELLDLTMSRGHRLSQIPPRIDLISTSTRSSRVHGKVCFCGAIQHISLYGTSIAQPDSRTRVAGSDHESWASIEP